MELEVGSVFAVVERFHMVRGKTDEGKESSGRMRRGKEALTMAGMSTEAGEAYLSASRRGRKNVSHDMWK